MKRKIIGVGVLLTALTIFFREDVGGLFASVNSKEVHAGTSKDHTSSAYSVDVMKQWHLPQELNEVSGIAYIGDNRFACVQDEEGYIFIYNTAAEKIEKKIAFAGAGDYEGITVKGSTAYVVRADGVIYQVQDFATAAKPAVTKFNTPLTVENNVEGLTYDRKNNRLLLALKDQDLVSQDKKGIYAFELGNNSFNKTPVYTIAMDHEMLGNKKKKNLGLSAIGLHPTSGEVYLLDGPKSRLIVLDKAGVLKVVKELGKQFAQPEGITFDEAGALYISNERGKKTAANIMQVAVR